MRAAAGRPAGVGPWAWEAPRRGSRRRRGGGQFRCGFAREAGGQEGRRVPVPERDREALWGPALWQSGTLLSFLPCRVSFTVNYKTTKTLSGLWPGGTLPTVEPLPRTPFFLWVSWPGCHWAQSPQDSPSNKLLYGRSPPTRRWWRSESRTRLPGQTPPAHPQCPPSRALGGACDQERPNLWGPLPPTSSPPTGVTLSPPQLLQGDPADGAGQRPGHEHTPGRDFPGGGTGSMGDPTPQD